jgi:hypothetical protein
MEPKAVKSNDKRVMVISNDSNVFLKKGIASAFEMFGGRLVEVKHLVARLDRVCDISFAIISGRFGFIPANYVIMQYAEVPSCKKDYEELQERKDFVGKTEYISRAFDKVIVCVPKEMFAMLIDALPAGKVIAVTSEEFRDVCKERGWSFYLRKGARVGKDNADAIIKEIKELNKKA